MENLVPRLLFKAAWSTPLWNHNTPTLEVYPFLYSTPPWCAFSRHEISVFLLFFPHFLTLLSHPIFSELTSSNKINYSNALPVFSVNSSLQQKSEPKFWKRLGLTILSLQRASPHRRLRSPQKSRISAQFPCLTYLVALHATFGGCRTRGSVLGRSSCSFLSVQISRASPSWQHNHAKIKLGAQTQLCRHKGNISSAFKWFEGGWKVIS